MTDTNERAFVRWQATTIAQLGYTNNLVIGLASGAVAFVVHLVTSAAPLIATSRLCVILAGIGFLLSVVLGLACALVRLYDFRVTSRIARSREQGDGSQDLEDLRSRAKALGSATWFLLWLQLIAFGAGAVLLALAIAAHRLSGSTAAA